MNKNNIDKINHLHIKSDYQNENYCLDTLSQLQVCQNLEPSKSFALHA